MIAYIVITALGAVSMYFARKEIKELENSENSDTEGLYFIYYILFSSALITGMGLVGILLRYKDSIIF